MRGGSGLQGWAECAHHTGTVLGSVWCGCAGHSSRTAGSVEAVGTSQLEWAARDRVSMFESLEKCS